MTQFMGKILPPIVTTRLSALPRGLAVVLWILILLCEGGDAGLPVEVCSCFGCQLALGLAIFVSHVFID